MKSLSIAILLTLAFAGSTLGQTVSDVVAKVRQIKLLESTRLDVRQILYRYKLDESGDHEDEFSNDIVRIDVYYSSGHCSDNPDEENQSKLWQVDEWKAVGMEIHFETEMSIEDVGVNLTKFKKEQIYRGSEDDHIFHDKETGWAFKVNEDGIDRVFVFPRSRYAKKVCEDADSETKAFYSRKSWFSTKLEERTGETSCPVPGVDEIELSATEISGATSEKTILVVSRVMYDGDNVLTYAYQVSAGQIKGKGRKVVWDLTGVPVGTYSITASVDDGCGFCGPTKTRTIIVK